MTGNVQWSGDQIIDEIEDRVWNGMLAVSRQVVQIATMYAPKKTGRLATSIHFDADRTNFAVAFIVDAPYGIFQEYGTRHMAPHPYLRPALNTVGPQYGFDFTMAFDATPDIHAPLIARGASFGVPSTLTHSQHQHVINRLKPVSQRHHIGNVSRAHLRVRGKRQS